uniref:Uncharacterized protein n=1 Tax=Anguilla anguilla TaxID=7936 RepID=A0A0E9UL72_ANGAN
MILCFICSVLAIYILNFRQQLDLTRCKNFQKKTALSSIVTNLLIDRSVRVFLDLISYLL